MKTKLLKKLRKRVRKNLRIVKWRTCYRVERREQDVFTGMYDWKEFGTPPFFKTKEEAMEFYQHTARALLLMELFECRKVVYK